MKNVELLAPAGSRESLEAAVKAGANAVYLAGQQFGARRSAANFSEEALLEAIDYCHLRGVKVYMTVNTLLRDEEIDALGDYLEPFYQHGLDAFIVQDLGVFKYLRTRFKDIALHCSTQMTLGCAQDVQTLLDMGASRVVMPRELSVEAIKTIYEETGAEIEAFVHGALCVSVSGQCLMSSLIGGRSGNRGTCAQSCRQPYKMLKRQDGTLEAVTSSDGDYLLSPRDLMTLPSLKALVASGIHSLKIEGRMKGPEYTYAVTSAYRKALDQIEFEASGAIETIEGVFSRDFTSGMILGTTNKAYVNQSAPGNRGVLAAEVLSYDKRQTEAEIKCLTDISKGDDLQARVKGNPGSRVEYIKDATGRIEFAKAGSIVKVNFKHLVDQGTPLYKTYNQPLMKALQQTINDEERRTLVNAELTLIEGQPAELSLTHEWGHHVKVKSIEVVEHALKTPLSQERIIEQLEKMGATPFKLDQVGIRHEGTETLAIKVLNQLRRDASDALIEAVLDATRREASLKVCQEDPCLTLSENRFDIRRPQISVSVRTEAQLRAAKTLNIERIYVHDIWQEADLWELLDSKAVVPYMGRFVETESIRSRIELLKALREKTGINCVLAASLGQAVALKSADFEVIADFSLNAMNVQALKVIADHGVRGTTLSPELSAEQLEALSIKRMENLETEILGYGWVPVMVSPYCPINGVYSASKEGCQICRKGQFYLEDKTGARFAVKGNPECQVEIFNSSCLNLADEWEAIESIGFDYYRILLLNESYEESLNVIEEQLKAQLGMTVNTKGQGFTKGHFRRGVL